MTTIVIVLFAIAVVILTMSNSALRRDVDMLHSDLLTLRRRDNKFAALKHKLAPLKDLPKVCKFCSTIGFQHSKKDCPYVVVSYAICDAEQEW
jgi:hypothetical protein